VKYTIFLKKSKFIGIEQEGVASFKGIKFANAKRFEAPKIIMNYPKIVNCDKYGNCAFQYSKSKTLVGNICTQSEDCLYLNI
jgi:carboxylesterase type B